MRYILEAAFGCAKEGGFDLVCFPGMGYVLGGFVLGGFSPTTDEEVGF